MLLFIIPTFARIFTDFGGELPLPTRIVMIMSNFLKGYWWALGGAVLGVITAIKRYYKTSSGRMRIDRFLLKMPILGEVLRKASHRAVHTHARER